MNNIVNISLVGAGNVALHIAHAIKSIGLNVSSFYARREVAAKELTDLLGSEVVYQKSLDFRESRSDLIVLCISDDALDTVIKQLVVPENATVVHTSGAVDMAVFSSNPEMCSFGILYPLQTFSKDRTVDFSEVPLLIESSDYSTRSRLLRLANQLSDQVKYISSEDRKHIHLAAVFANNFTNHLLKIAFDQLSMLQVDRRVLQPLIMETVLKAIEEGPEASQTGPAKRGDEKSISAHLELLSKDPDSQELYKLLSDQIKSHFHK